MIFIYIHLNLKKYWDKITLEITKIPLKLILFGVILPGIKGIWNYTYEDVLL